MSAARNLRPSAALALAVAFPIAAHESAELAPRDGRPVLHRIDAPGFPYVARVDDGATIYLNTDAPSYGLAPPAPGIDPGLVGDRVIVAACGDVPLEIREVEFAFEVTQATSLQIRISIWDRFGTSTAPVHADLLRSETVDFGATPLAVGSYVTQLPFSPPLALADPDTFWVFELRTSGLGTQPFAPAAMLFALRGTGPEVGSQGELNNFYRDVNPNGPNPPAEDGVLTHPGDARTFANAGQSNLYLQIRGAPDPDVLGPGTDLWRTLANGSTLFDLTPYGYQGAFDYDDAGEACAPIPFEISSDPIEGGFPLRGAPIATVPSGALAASDTLIRRASRICLPPPHETTSIALEIQALALVGATPLTVTYDSGNYTSQWDVTLRLSPRPQPIGSMTLTRDGCPAAGGSFSALLPVLPRVAFARRPPDPPCNITIDFGINFYPPLVLSIADGRWSTTPTASLLQISAEDVAFDRNGDGVAAPGEGVLSPTTTGFHLGVGTPRCDRDACAPGAAPVRRSTAWVSPELTLSLQRTATELQQADQDLDLVVDEADDCPLAPDPQQADGDEDGVGDTCDNCVSVCNPDQGDADVDEIGDACDCPQSGPPAEVSSLTLAADRATIEWTALAAATSYEVVRGSVSALPVGSDGGGELCLGPVPVPAIVDTTVPAGSQAFYYLVRARNGCAAGPLGYRAEQGTRTSPRRTPTCP